MLAARPRHGDLRRPAAWALLAVVTAGCANSIALPQAAETRSVYVLDLGRHSRLAVARPDGDIVEYAYGEWRWYARMEDAWWRLPAVLLWPTRGGLGRREWRAPRAAAALRAAYGEPAVLELAGDRRRTDALVARLDREFARGTDRLVRNAVYGLDFVPSDRDYWLFNNSNHAVREWLQACGFRVMGSGMFADWERAE